MYAPTLHSLIQITSIKRSETITNKKNQNLWRPKRGENVLTWVANRGLDSVTALKKKLHEPRSNVTGRTGDADDLTSPAAHFL